MLRILISSTVFLFTLLSCTSSTLKEKCCLPTLQKESFVFVKTETTFYICSDNGCHMDLSSHSKSVGSGFIVGAKNGDSLGVTAAHICIPDSPKDRKVHHVIKVQQWGGGSYAAEPVQILEEVDVCILKIKGITLPTLKLARKAPAHGDAAYTLSAPHDIWEPDMVLTFDGFYSGKSRNILGHDILDTYTIPAKGGSSGSPIFNHKGEIIGMTIIAMRGLESFNLSPQFHVLESAIKSALTKM